MALIILRLRQLKEGAVLSESLQSQVRRSLSFPLSLFKGPREIKVQKTNPRRSQQQPRRRQQQEEEKLELGWRCGVAGPAQLPFIKSPAAEEGGRAPALPTRSLARSPRHTPAQRAPSRAALHNFLLGIWLSSSWTFERFGVERGRKQRHPRGAENTTVCVGSRQRSRTLASLRSPNAGRPATLPSSLGREASPASACVSAVAGRLRGAGGSRRSQRHAKLQVRQGDRPGEQERRQPGAQQQPEEGRQQAGAAHLPRPLLPLSG